MAVDERTRYELFLRLEQVLGPNEAATLMEHLPPVGWGEVATKRDLDQLAVATKRDLDQLAVATKRDLDQLEERLNLRIETSEHRVVGTLRGDLISQTRTMIFAMTGAVMTAVGLAIAAARLV